MASDQIFSLNADASLEGRTQGEVAGGKLYAGAQLQLAACHGVDFEVAAAAGAQGDVLVDAIASLRAQGAISLSGGLRARASLEPAIFDTFSAGVEASAYLEAAVAGSLGIGLSLEQLVDRVAAREPDLLVELCRILAAAVEIEAGVWGKASVSVAARGFVVVEGKLLPGAGEPAGFQVRAGAAAGFEFGAGWDLYLRLGLSDPRRLYAETTGALTRALIAPVEDEGLANLAELGCDLAWSALYEIGLAASADDFDADALLERLGELVVGRVRALLVDTLEQLAGDLLGLSLRRGALESLISGDFTALLRAQNELEGLLDELEAGALDPALLEPAFAAILDLLEQLPGLEREPLLWGCGLLWATHAAFAEREAPQVTAPPATLAADLRERLDRHANHSLVHRDAVELLLREAGDIVGPFARPEGPARRLADLARSLGIGLDTLVELASAGDWRSVLASTEIAARLREFVTRQLDELLLGRLVDHLRARTPEASVERELLDEVFAPALAVSSAVIARTLDAALAGATGAELAKAARDGAGAVVLAALGRSFAVIVSEIFEFSVGELHGSFEALAARIDAGEAHPMVDDLTATLPAPLAGLPSSLRAAERGCRRTIVEMCRLGAELFGPEIWTADRLARQRRALAGLCSPLPTQAELAAGPGAVDAFFAELGDCSVELGGEDLEALQAVAAEVLLDSLELLQARLAPGLSAELVVEFGRELFERFEVTVARRVDQAKDARDRLSRRLEDIDEDIDELTAGLERELGVIAAAWQRLATIVGHADRRRAVNTLLRDLKTEALTLAPAAAVEVAFDAFEPIAHLLLPPVFARIAPIVEAVAEAVGEASDSLRAARELRERLQTVLTGALGAQLDGLGPLRSRAVDAAVELFPGAQGVVDFFSAAILELLERLGLDAIEAAALEHARLAASLENQRVKRAGVELERRQAQAKLERRQRLPEALRLIRPTRSTGAGLVVHPGELSLEIELEFAGASAFEIDQLLCSVNGQTLEFDAAERRELGRGRVRIERRLSVDDSALVQGHNVILVAYANDRGGPRVAQSCWVDLQGAARPVEIVAEESRFDTPGNDHQRLREEKLTLRNRSAQTLALKGWRVLDQRGHVYEFGARELAPGARVTLVTGVGKDDAATVYWGRGRAVWNNPGDTVYVVDPARVLRGQYRYGDGGLRRSPATGGGRDD